LGQTCCGSGGGTPLHSAGSPKSSFSQPTETCSSCIASGELTQLNAIWSSALASQSAASAAGVPPPITKWKKRGPADRVAPASAASISVRSAGERTHSFVRERAADPVRSPHRAHQSLVDACKVLGGLSRDEPEALVQHVAIQDRVAHGGDPLTRSLRPPITRAWRDGC